MRNTLLFGGAIIGAALVWWVGDHIFYECSDLLKACAEIVKP